MSEREPEQFHEVPESRVGTGDRTDDVAPKVGFEMNADVSGQNELNDDENNGCNAGSTLSMLVRDVYANAEDVSEDIHDLANAGLLSGGDVCDTDVMPIITDIRDASENVAIPCPADGDLFVFTNDVDAYLRQKDCMCQCEGGLGVTRYAIIELGNDQLGFVLYSSQEGVQELTLLKSCPGFDATLMWRAEDADQHRWLMCIHFPVSGRKPVPDECKAFVWPCQLMGNIAGTIVQGYLLDGIETAATWREAQHFVAPSSVYRILTFVCAKLNAIFESGHRLLRISPENIVLRDDEILFMGVESFDLPWNERCAIEHSQGDLASVPPECFGFLRQRMTSAQAVYILGAMAYYLVAGNRVPTCDALNFEPALEPRAFNPTFPIGWDEIIHTSLHASPEFRYRSVAEFMNAMSDALDFMHERRDFRSTLQYDAAVDTHIGVTKRLKCPVNQDAVFMRKSENGQRILMVVADGVSTSTYGSGDIASHIVIAKAEEAWNKRIEAAKTLSSIHEISLILLEANKEICQYIRDRFADKNPTASECMGTTALVGIIEDGILTLGAVGDSRAYIIRDDSMSCITRDHNLFTVGIINGLPVEMCAVHPHAGSLVQCLGYNEENQDGTDLAYDVYSMSLIPGDTLMLTTDGILDYVACELTESEAKIADVVRHAHNSALACLELIMQANLGGGGDNCGVGIVRASLEAE